MQITNAIGFPRTIYTLWDYSDLLLSQEHQNKKALNIYPNPSDKNISINFSDNFSNVNRFVIIDIIGRRVKEGEIGNNENINIEELRSGTYIIELSDYNGTKAVNKFIKL